MKKKIKILTVVNSLNMGGIENTLLSCIKQFNPEKIKITICCFKYGGVLENEFKNLNVEVIYIKKTGLIILDFIQMLFLLLFEKFDAVHSRFGFTSGGFVLAGKILKVPVIVSLHSTNPSALGSYKRKQFIYKLLSLHLKLHKWITLRFASKIVGHSKSNLNQFYKNWENNDLFKLIYNGIDFSKLDYNTSQSNNLDNFINEDDFVILHIGSFRKEKNHKFLIQSFASLLKKSAKYKLILVGNGSLEEDMKKLTSELEIEENVFFAGFDKAIRKYFDVANLFVLPSIIEGFGNVLIEAQYCSVPISVSDLSSLRESGYSGYHNYYFNPAAEKDFVNKIGAIEKRITNGDLHQSIFEANVFACNFSIQTMAEELRQLYIHLIKIA